MAHKYILFTTNFLTFDEVKVVDSKIWLESPVESGQNMDRACGVCLYILFYIVVIHRVFWIGTNRNIFYFSWKKGFI